ncbi:hypothetical protein NCG97_36535 [Streptomyces lydicamycinicus]|nr:hypothetical protein NCG97_36535 [Streptomyces lydicamycinicus]
MLLEGKWAILFEFAPMLSSQIPLLPFMAPGVLHSIATLILEQGVDLVVIKELLGYAHIGVTAGVCAHVRLRLQCQASTLNDALSSVDDSTDDPPAVGVR